MIMYKNGRLYTDGVSFPMVEGYYLNEECGIELDKGLGFFNENRDIAIQWELKDVKNHFSYNLQYTIDLIARNIMTPITKFELNGLDGCYCIYDDETTQYFEAHFDIGNKKILIFAVEAGNGQDIYEIIKQSDIQELLKGLKKENN